MLDKSMNGSHRHRQNTLGRIDIECLSFESVDTSTHIRLNHRRKTVSIVPIRSLLFSLLLALSAFVCGSSLGGRNKAIGSCMITTAFEMRTVAFTTLRRSARIRSISAKLAANPPEQQPPKSSSADPSTTTSRQRQRNTRSTSSATDAEEKGRKRKAKAKPKTTKTKAKTARKEVTKNETSCLPRTQEKSILSSGKGVHFVMGVDEAGRGPLAGPVVAAAAIVPVDIDGITDSKKITKEEDREDLYKAITESPNVRWAVAVMDAPFIDKVNILQATMRGMSAAATALVANAGPPSVIELGEESIPIVSTLTIEQKGCYVITNNSSDNKSKRTTQKAKKVTVTKADSDTYRALVDGNRVPPDMPCESHSIVKGDGKEYAIAAASILAKVSRDRLMRDYHDLWPHFGLEQHKGYPTAAHMQAVKTFGASPIHRMTFRPLKDMTFDKDGKVIK